MQSPSSSRTFKQRSLSHTRSSRSSSPRSPGAHDGTSASGSPSLVQVTLGGVVISAVGVLLGQA